MRQQFKKQSNYLVATVMLLASSVLIGWQFNIDIFTRPIPRLVAMNPTTAMCFIMIGISLFLLDSSKKKWVSIIIYSFSILPLLIGAIRLIGIIVGFNSQLDTFLFREKLESALGGCLSNSMAPNAAFNFMLIGSALVLYRLNTKLCKNIANYAVFIILLVALFATIGYIYKVKEFYGMGSYIPMAIHTTFGFIMIGLSFLFINRQAGLMSIVCNENSGGTLARILIPTTIITPILFGYIRLVFHWKFQIPTESGIAFLITGIILVFLVLILSVSLIINKKDAIRKVVEDKLAQVNTALEQKIQERTEELIKNEILFRSLIENSHDMLILIDTDGAMEYISPAAERIFGYSVDENSKRNFIEIVHPDDVEITQAQLKQASVDLGVAIPSTIRNKKKNDTYIWVEGFITNMFHVQGIKAIVANFHDVTEKKRAEQSIKEERILLRTLIDNLPINIYVKDIYSRKILSNRTDYEYVGTTSEKDVLGRDDSDFFSAESVKNTTLEEQHIFATGEAIISKEEHHIKIDGSDTWFLKSKIPLRNEHNEITGLVGISYDITERKELENQQILLASIINSSDDAIISKTLNGIISSWNRGAEVLFGYSPNEAIGRSITMLIPPSHVNKEIEVIEKVKRGEYIERSEEQRVKKNGDIIYVSITVSPIKDRDGKIIGASKIARDISERKEAVEKLNNERSLLRTLIDNLPDYIYVKDIHSRHLINNKANLNLFGATTEEETIGKTAVDILGADTATPYLQDDELVFKCGLSVIDREESIISSTGELKYLLTTKVPLKSDNNTIIGLVGISRDITRQKKIELDLQQSNYFLRMAQHVGHIGQWISDIGDGQGGNLTWSDETCQIFGLTPEEFDNKNETFFEFVHPEDLEKVQSTTSLAAENNQPYSLDHRIILRNGAIKWVHEQGELVCDENTKTRLLIGIVQDITAQKRAEGEILELNAELEERVMLRTEQLQAANKELEAFSYSVSHDLRAPLRIINGFANILLEDYSTNLDDEGKKTLGIITDNALKMGMLIDDLLNFSKLGRTEMRKRKIDMNKIVKDVLEDLKLSGLDIPKRIHIDQLQPAYCDGNLIRHVWINLISNAIKYSSALVSPEIEIGMQGSNGNEVYYVKDNGAGFDMQYYHKLFGVFQRLHNFNEFAGTGVGLAIVQRIIYRHGGKVWAEAKVNEGATFYFSFSKEHVQ